MRGALLFDAQHIRTPRELIGCGGIVPILSAVAISNRPPSRFVNIPMKGHQ